ncbi:hypothetical protein B0J13DRAFT_134654 [Dactylonectria estremocensis]|uniref:Uncharacterized protein n=1 Tax=Dactylonectria estremocensis TaxID=1079267 RepID=A0A9P9E3M2_9HYPO|nr:hypothetical protein B0J13DRAFT_134654 [Dactylonectria estremocensis]
MERLRAGHWVAYLCGLVGGQQTCILPMPSLPQQSAVPRSNSHWASITLASSATIRLNRSLAWFFCVGPPSANVAALFGRFRSLRSVILTVIAFTDAPRLGRDVYHIPQTSTIRTSVASC